MSGEAYRRPSKPIMSYHTLAIRVYDMIWYHTTAPLHQSYATIVRVPEYILSMPANHETLACSASNAQENSNVVAICDPLVP